uniref:Uncharacterized protein n=1 Tax=Chenopodium quinoa TaxID=63459 RepID=A0A803LEC5_CHEQI
MTPDPITQVGNTADVAPETSVSSPPSTSIPSNEHPSLTPVLSDEHSPDNSPVEVTSKNSETDNVPETNNFSSDVALDRYQLPPRSTRGIPPRRYDPKYESQQSRYPVEKISNENLSSMAIAFSASLYSSDIPKTVEDALGNKKWKQAMEEKTGMLDCKPAETPIATNHGLQILEGAKLAEREQYQKIVGKLIYLAQTRPDIAYAVGVVSRFMHLPQIQHMIAVMRILRYLKGTSCTGIYFAQNGHLDLIAYTDADWAGDRDDRKSTSGYFTLVGGNLVTWRSKKQKVVALSSAEAEFRRIAKGITEILWIRKLMKELGFPQKTA